MGNILTFENVDAGYGRVQILHDLSFSVITWFKTLVPIHFRLQSEINKMSLQGKGHWPWQKGTVLTKGN